MPMIFCMAFSYKMIKKHKKLAVLIVEIKYFRGYNYDVAYYNVTMII